MKKYLALALIALIFLSCTTKTYLHRINFYLNAHSVKDRGRYLSNDYHSFFMETKGQGKDRTHALQSFSNWDAPLHPDVTILNYTVNGDNWSTEINEQNDFSKLIGFPGWKATEIIKFNPKGKISEVTYLPNEDNPDYKKWLEPAIQWLQKNKPFELNEIYKEESLVQTPQTATKWIELLRQWRQETTAAK